MHMCTAQTHVHASARAPAGAHVTGRGCVRVQAGEALKESHVKNGQMTDLNGEVVKTSVQTYKFDLFELPNLEFKALTQIKSLDVVIDGRNVRSPAHTGAPKARPPTAHACERDRQYRR